jgi:hypothetical protein
MANYVFSLATSVVSRGFDASYDAGTTADIIVDSGGGGDYTTIQAAVNAATTGQVIAVRDGTYRENVDFGSAATPITLKGYGTEKPLITGQEVLTGWTQCSASDATRLGATLGIASSPVYKKNVSNASLPSGTAKALNLYEGEEYVPICQTKSGDKFYFNNKVDFNQADSFTVNGSNQITAITDNTVFAGLTAAQMTGADSDAFIYVWHNPNAVSPVNITAFNDGTDTATVDGLETIQGGSDSGSADYYYNLANCLPKLTTGTYGYVDEGDGTTTIYVYPSNSANMTSGISYGARDNIIDLDFVGSVTLEGLKILGTAGTGNDKATCVRMSGQSVERTGITIKQCLIGDSTSASGGNGCIYFGWASSATIEQCSFRNIAGNFGIFFQGGLGANIGTDNIVNKCTFNRVSQAGLRVYNNTDFQFTFCDLTNVGIGAHGNVWNFYEQCDKILVYGVRSRDVGGYGTWQEASRIFVGFCDFEGMINSESTSRTLIDQTNATDQPTIPSLNYVWNCALHPSSLHDTPVSSLELGNFYNTTYPDATQPANMSWYMDNNIVYGGGVSEAYANPGTNRTHWRDQVGYDDTHIEREREGNIYTGLNFWQDVAYGWSANASETVNTTLSSVYTDYANNDYTAPGGSPILTASGVPISTIVSAASALFPSFDFGLDGGGKSFSGTPAPGPYQEDYNSQVAWYTP